MLTATLESSQVLNGSCPPAFQRTGDSSSVDGVVDSLASPYKLVAKVEAR